MARNSAPISPKINVRTCEEVMQTYDNGSVKKVDEVAENHSINLQTGSPKLGKRSRSKAQDQLEHLQVCGYIVGPKQDMNLGYIRIKNENEVYSVKSLNMLEYYA